MKKMSMEFKVGVFILLAMGILSAIVFQIGGLNVFKTDRYNLQVVFDFVNGIEVNAPVHFAGVTVGEVKNVAIFYNDKKRKTQVRLIIAIKETVKIPKNSVAYINTLGILGEKYVEIVPSGNWTEFMTPNDFIIGNNPVQMEKLTESLVDVIGDQTVRDSLRQSFYNTRQVTDNLLETSKVLNEIALDIKKGKGTVGRFLNDESIYAHTDEMILNLNRRLEEMIANLDRQLTELVTDLKKHPWKLLQRNPSPRAKAQAGSEETAAGSDKSGANKGIFFKK